MRQRNFLKAIITMLVLSAFSCKKSAFLDTKPDQSLVVPTTLYDFQAILDNDAMMNGDANNGLTPSLGEIGADNYYIFDSKFDAVSLLSRNLYTWASHELYASQNILDWDFPYRCVFYSNIVLDGLSKLSIAPEEQTDWNNAKGSALFYRAYMFYELAQVFAPSYDSASANKSLGIPLRLSSDINEKLHRSNLSETYGQTIDDLKASLLLLPSTPLYATRPSRPAAYALLARLFLSVRDYHDALLYSDSCLQISSSLLDFNTLSTSRTFPFPRFNQEVIFHSILLSENGELLKINGAIVDSNLYSSYDSNDLRRTAYYKNLISAVRFRGSYDGSGNNFSGLATDEMYLIRAECNARAGNVIEALSDLNTLLQTRWASGTFVPFTATTPNDALKLILNERRKELCFRGLRWEDLRRLNKDPDFQVTLQRIVEGQSYSLPPNDLKYTYPIPDNVIASNPGMPQNPR